ncbi:MAG: 16S rRNA (cytidine(1402)-2'-O)-methyltransferase [Candidatus Cyclobacteriaceae bacterium M3_2C_046]
MTKTSLYIIPTPIGNLEDITFRAVRVLKEVDLILAEDTRTSGKLLKHYAIHKPLQSFHIHNEHKILPHLMERLKQGECMGLITDAGTPGISDPGFLIVRECLQQQIKIECLPGATAFIPALVKSGFPTDSFVFMGFLPHKKGRHTLMEQLKEEKRTVIFYESPHRLLKTLQQFREYLDADRELSVSRELTKVFEETLNGTAEELLHHFNQHPAKGEFVVILSGKK